jgi:hypothetical protein
MASLPIKYWPLYILFQLPEDHWIIGFRHKVDSSSVIVCLCLLIIIANCSSDLLKLLFLPLQLLQFQIGDQPTIGARTPRPQVELRRVGQW